MLNFSSQMIYQYFRFSENFNFQRILKHVLKVCKNFLKLFWKFFSIKIFITESFKTHVTDSDLNLLTGVKS